MNRIIAPFILVAALIGGIFLAEQTRSMARAQGMIDAGPPVAVPVVVDPSVAVPATVTRSQVVIVPPVVVDPINHPARAVQDVKDAYAKTGGVVAGVLALCILVGALSARAKPGTFLDRGRLPMMLAAASSTLGVLMLALTHEVPWTAFLATLGTSIGAVLHPDPPAPDKKLPLASVPDSK